MRPRRTGVGGARWAAIWIGAAFPACRAEPSRPTPPEVDGFVALANGPALPVDHTCHGSGHSPALTWRPDAAPEGTRFLAWVMSSPSGVSWTAWDAPIELAGVRADFPAAHAPPLQGPNLAGQLGWAPPCPPAATGPVVEDALQMVVYALPSPLAAPPTLPVADLQARLEAHALARTSKRLDIRVTP